MSINTTYNPVFTDSPTSCLARWQAIREFVRQWYGIALGPAGIVSEAAINEEQKLGVSLPLAFREYITFAHELLAQPKELRMLIGTYTGTAFSIMGDTYMVERLDEYPEHGAVYPETSLLCLAEGEGAWAVTDADLAYEDPPVYYHHFDHEATALADGRLFAPTITAFVLQHLSQYLEGAGGGLLARISGIEDFVATMKDLFPIYCQFDDLHVFEKENIFACITPEGLYGRREFRVNLKVWNSDVLNDVHDYLLSHARANGAFHGALFDMMKKCS